MQIKFDGGAAETFARFLNELEGLGGEVTTVEGETFDGIINGNDPDSGWYDAARVRPWDFDADRPAGDEITVRIETFKVF